MNRTTTATVFAVLALAGCGVNETVDAAGPSDGVTEEPIEVTLVDYDFVGLPDTVAAGTRLTVTNDAPTELHELVAFRLPDDDERPLDELAQLAPTELEQALGAPAAVLLAPPGGEQIAAIGDGTLDEPGRYAIICFIPTGVEPDVYLQAAAGSEGPPQVEGGPPHFVHGMATELIVEE